MRKKRKKGRQAPTEKPKDKTPRRKRELANLTTAVALVQQNT
jgi:hypothetical protein